MTSWIQKDSPWSRNRLTYEMSKGAAVRKEGYIDSFEMRKDPLLLKKNPTFSNTLT